MFPSKKHNNVKAILQRNSRRSPARRRGDGPTPGSVPTLLRRPGAQSAAGLGNGIRAASSAKKTRIQQPRAQKPGPGNRVIFGGGEHRHSAGSPFKRGNVRVDGTDNRKIAQSAKSIRYLDALDVEVTVSIATGFGRPPAEAAVWRARHRHRPRPFTGPMGAEGVGPSSSTRARRSRRAASEVRHMSLRGSMSRSSELDFRSHMGFGNNDRSVGEPAQGLERESG